MRAQSGIYKITNQINGKIYIGQSKNVFERKKQHFVALYHGYHENKLMQEDWDENNRGFRFDIVEFCPLALLNEKEQYWIKKLNTMEPNGYNQGWVPYKRKVKQKKFKIKGYHKSS